MFTQKRTAAISLPSREKSNSMQISTQSTRVLLFLTASVCCARAGNCCTVFDVGVICTQYIVYYIYICGPYWIFFLNPHSGCILVVAVVYLFVLQNWKLCMVFCRYISTECISTMSRQHPLKMDARAFCNMDNLKDLPKSCKKWSFLHGIYNLDWKATTSDSLIKIFSCSSTLTFTLSCFGLCWVNPIVWDLTKEFTGMWLRPVLLFHDCPVSSVTRPKQMWSSQHSRSTSLCRPLTR